MWAKVLVSEQSGREEGDGGRENACEHIAEECGCGLLPKAYAILMFPWVREGKMRLDSWGRVRTQMLCEDIVICH